MAENVPQEEKKTWRVSLFVKLLVGFTLVFAVVFAVAFYWFYNFTSDRAEQRIVEDMVDTLMGTAANIDGDMLVALYEEGVPREDGYTDDTRYWEHVRWLAAAAEIEPRANFYTYVPGDEEYEIVYIGSSWAVREPPEGVHFLESYISSGSSWRGLSETVLKLEEEGHFGYFDDYGYWISGRTPIYNSAGEKVGALGIDFEAGYVLEVRQAIEDRIVLAFGITYITLFALVLVIARTLSRPIVELTRVAEKASLGYYNQDLSHLQKGRLRDEISTLAAVFDVMIDKVQAREKNLRRQVEELRIEIDHAKRAKQVDEIVDTDFFQDLRARAREMRRLDEIKSEPTGAISPETPDETV
ncbi:MAG: HAMP domain-containing protein [Anaerolineae bacterium]|nr:HAMP domain-containing protein [Anaerolineae bacterium]